MTVRTSLKISGRVWRTYLGRTVLGNDDVFLKCLRSLSSHRGPGGDLRNREGSESDFGRLRKGRDGRERTVVPTDSSSLTPSPTSTILPTRVPTRTSRLSSGWLSRLLNCGKMEGINLSRTVREGQKRGKKDVRTTRSGVKVLRTRLGRGPRELGVWDQGGRRPKGPWS